MEYVIGFFIGSALGLTGAGGSLFSVPLIILFLNQPPADAMGIALGAVSVSAIFGVTRQFNSVLWMPVLLLSTTGVMTAPMGRYIATHMNELSLLIGFSVVTLIIALRMWREATRNTGQDIVVRASIQTASADASFPCRLSPTGYFQWRFNCIVALVFGGFVIGFVSGLFGVGGGFLIVPYLLYLGQISMRIAIATSLAIIVLISTSGFISYLSFTESINIVLLIKLMVFSVLGMLLSQRLAKHIANLLLQKIFAFMLALTSIATIWAYW